MSGTRRVAEALSGHRFRACTTSWPDDDVAAVDVVARCRDTDGAVTLVSSSTSTSS